MSTTSARAEGGLGVGSPRNQQTNIPGLYAIGECDYQYHGANRLGANSLLSCIFSGLIVAPGIDKLLEVAQGGAGRRAAGGAVRAAPPASTRPTHDAPAARGPAAARIRT